MLSNSIKIPDLATQPGSIGKKFMSSLPPEVNLASSKRTAGQTSPVLSQKRTVNTAPLRPLDELNVSYLNSPDELVAEIERQARELQVLHQMRAALIGVNNLDAIFTTIVQTIASILEVSIVSVYRLRGSELVMQAQVGYEQYFEILPLAGGGIYARVALHGKGELVLDVRQDLDYLEAVPDVASIICVPLLGPGMDVIGTLALESPASRKLDQRDLKLCQALAEQATLAVSQALAFERESRRLSQMALLNQVGRDLAASLDIDHIIQGVTGPVRRKLNLYSVNIGLIQGQELIFRMAPGAAGEGREYRWPLDHNNLVCQSARTGELVMCLDVSTDPRFEYLPEMPDTKSKVIFPLRSAGQIIGVLDVESDGSRAFEDEDIILFKTLADQTSVALANARRFTDLQRQSRELNASNRALAQANRLKSEFLANVSHELRTPLNSIIGYVDMIQSGFYGEVPADMNDPMERVFRNGRRLLALINDVLDMANIEAGRMQLNFEEVTISDLLAALQAEGQIYSQEKPAVRLEVEMLANTPRTVQVDIQRIKQVVSSLLSNAFKFTPAGEVRIQIGASSAQDSQPGYFIKISDTGIGIPSNEFEHIFEEFRQVDGSSTRQFGGTGLGLALARRLVLEMLGTLEVKSLLGEGSAFTIWLPLTPSSFS